MWLCSDAAVGGDEVKQRAVGASAGATRDQRERPVLRGLCRP